MKFLKWLGVATLLVVPFFLVASVVHAQRFSGSIAEDQVVHGSVYSSGKVVEIKGTVYGDVYCAGQTVVVEATVYGDVICAGYDVTIGGKVSGDVRVGGQVVSIDGEVAKNVSAAAMSFSLDREAVVGQDLTAFGANVGLRGSIGRDAVLSGGQLALNGKIGRNVAVQSDMITLKEDARIGGNITYTGKSQPKLESGAKVEGNTMQTTATSKQRRGFNPMLYLVAVIGLMIIGFLLVLLFPRQLQKATGRLRKDSLPSVLLSGLVAMVLLPVIMAGLVISMVGIPLLIALLIGVAGTMMLSGPIVAYGVGKLITRNKPSAPAIMAIGTAVLVTIYFIPFIGFMAMLMVFVLGMGIIWLELKARATPVAFRSKAKK